VIHAHRWMFNLDISPDTVLHHNLDIYSGIVLHENLDLSIDSELQGYLDI